MSSSWRGVLAVVVMVAGRLQKSRRKAFRANLQRKLTVPAGHEPNGDERAKRQYQHQQAGQPPVLTESCESDLLSRYSTPEIGHPIGRDSVERIYAGGSMRHVRSRSNAQSRLVSKQLDIPTIPRPDTSLERAQTDQPDADDPARQITAHGITIGGLHRF
jgi:hypothetical protein